MSHIGPHKPKPVSVREDLLLSVGPVFLGPHSGSWIIAYSPFQEVVTIVDIGSWSLLSLPLPSALTSALVLQ